MQEPTYTKGLNDLQDLLVDSRKGYAEDPKIKHMLDRFSSRRQPFINDLVDQRRRLDKDYKPSNGTVKGDLHRTWMDVRDSLSSTENANVLRECERGEEYLLGRYDEVMRDEHLPDDLRGLLQQQRATIQADLDQVKQDRRMKDSLE